MQKGDCACCCISCIVFAGKQHTLPVIFSAQKKALDDFQLQIRYKGTVLPHQLLTTIVSSSHGNRTVSLEHRPMCGVCYGSRVMRLGFHFV